MGDLLLSPPRLLASAPRRFSASQQPPPHSFPLFFEPSSVVPRPRPAPPRPLLPAPPPRPARPAFTSRWTSNCRGEVDAPASVPAPSLSRPPPWTASFPVTDGRSILKITDNSHVSLVNIGQHAFLKNLSRCDIYYYILDCVNNKMEACAGARRAPIDGSCAEVAGKHTAFPPRPPRPPRSYYGDMFLWRRCGGAVEGKPGVEHVDVDSAGGGV
ncbi:Protein of unknown function [Gryllus bimaculatus]|nr:Protein of unknown function [Gryllus bimaculatus]